MNERQNIRSKLDTILLSSKMMSIDKIRTFCQSLDTMTHDERVEAVKSQWGEAYLGKAMPVLMQLDALDRQEKHSV
jgi:hypothetical protein